MPDNKRPAELIAQYAASDGMISEPSVRAQGSRTWRGQGVAVLLLLALCSCEQKVDHDPTSKAVVPEVQAAPAKAMVPGEVFASGDYLGRPMLVEVSGGNLWVADFSGDPWVHLFDIASGARKASVGRKGQGPGEYQSVLGFFRDPRSPGGLWVFDANGGRLTSLRDGRASVEVGATVRLPASGGFPLLVTKAGDGFIALAPDSTVAWVRFGPDGSVLGKTAGTMLGHDSVPAAARLQHSQTVHVCSRPGGERFAVVYYGAGRVEIRGADGALHTAAAVPFPSEPEFKISQRTGLLTWTRTTSRYSSCAGTIHRLYALYAGKDDRQLPDRTRPVGSDEGAEVHVFDWDGKFLESYQLSEEIVALAVSQDDSVLYGVSAQRAQVYRFPLNGRHR